MYEHQIKKTNTYDINLDDGSIGFLQNCLIYLLSTPMLHPPLWMENSITEGKNGFFKVLP